MILSFLSRDLKEKTDSQYLEIYLKSKRRSGLKVTNCLDQVWISHVRQKSRARSLWAVCTLWYRGHTLLLLELHVFPFGLGKRIIMFLQWNLTYSLNKELWKCLCKVHTVWVILLLRTGAWSEEHREVDCAPSPSSPGAQLPSLSTYLAWPRMVLTQDIFVDAQGFLF